MIVLTRVCTVAENDHSRTEITRSQDAKNEAGMRSFALRIPIAPYHIGSLYSSFALRIPASRNFRRVREWSFLAMLGSRIAGEAQEWSERERRSWGSWNEQRIAG